MVKVNKPVPSAYVAPGTMRIPMHADLIRAIMKVRGPLWLMEQIMDTVCAVTKITREKIYNEDRFPDIVMARHLLRFYAWEIVNPVLSLREITLFVTNGRNKDHSSVVNSRKVIRAAMTGKGDWNALVLKHMHEIDYKLNQINVNEGNSTNG